MAYMDICEKLLSDPNVLFLVTAAMFLDGSKIPTPVLYMRNTLSNMHNKFGSNWSGSDRFLKEVTLKIAKNVENGQ